MSLSQGCSGIETGNSVVTVCTLILFVLDYHRKHVLSVKRTYVYDDGKENLQNDTFEREPYIVHFASTRTSK